MITRSRKAVVATEADKSNINSSPLEVHPNPDESRIKRKREDPINYFDKLPDELLVKIFRHFIVKEEVEDEDDDEEDEDRGYIVYRDANWINSSIISLENLSVTCKRFCYIINNKLCTIYDWNQYPTLLLHPKNKKARHESCKSRSRLCHCGYIRERAHFKFVKYRKLRLMKLGKITGCVPLAIQQEQANLSSINELEMSTCMIDSAVLHNLLNSLPSITRLFIKSCVDMPGRERLVKEPLGRTLVHLGFEYSDQDDSVSEYILNNLRAHTVDLRFNGSPPKNLDWLRRFLSKHKATMMYFKIRFIKGLDERIPQVPEIFKDFDYKYIITDSSGHVQDPKYDGPEIEEDEFADMEFGLHEHYYHEIKSTETSPSISEEFLDLELEDTWPWCKL